MIDENSRIVYMRPDGVMNIASPAPIEHLRQIPGFEEMTQIQYENHVLGRSIPRGVEAYVVSASDFPADRYFRDAWLWSNTNGVIAIGHDLEKCKAIQLDRMRIARKPVLEALDVEYIVATEKKDTAWQDTIAAQKQALRDVTAVDMTNVKTPEDIRAIWPEVLPPQ